MWIKTSKDIYEAIRKHYDKDLWIWGTFTDIDWTSVANTHWMKPVIDTVYYYKYADTPLIRILQLKEDRHQIEWSSEYFLYIHYNI
jgi:hypothetical protein